LQAVSVLDLPGAVLDAEPGVTNPNTQGIYVLRDANNSEGWPSELVEPFFPTTVAVLDLAFDGSHMWCATTNKIGKIHALTQGTPVLTGAYPSLQGLIFDGCHMWVAHAAVLSKVDTDLVKKLGNIALPGIQAHGTFDGTHLWVATRDDKVNAVQRILVG
jgi:hypothetical protein